MSASDPASDSATRAVEQFRAGNFEQAVEHWHSAEQAYTQAGNTAGQLRALQGRGEAYLALGLHRKAATAFAAVRSEALQSKNSELAAAASVGLGSAARAAGGAEDALRHYQQAIALARPTGNRSLLATARNELGVLYAQTGEFDDAAEQYRSAIEDADAVAHSLLAAKILVNHAKLEHERADSATAARLLQRAKARLNELPPSHDVALAWLSVGRLHQRNAAHLPAYHALDRAIRMASSHQDHRASTFGLGYLGELYASQGRHDESLALYRRALHYAQLSNSRDALYRWNWHVGRLLRDAGDREGAIDAYQRAVQVLQQIGPELAVRQKRGGGFQNEVAPLYLELADLLLARASAAAEPARAQADLVQVRATMELLKGAELEDYFEDDCVTALRARTRGIDTLSAHTAAIYPIVFPDRLQILVSLPDGIHAYSTPVDAERFRSEVHALRQFLEKRTTRQYLPSAQQIYDWLIRPLESDLERADIRTLVIVPDGALRLIPLAALHDGTDFLVRRYVVATSPGLTLTDPHPIQRTDANVMINGLTKGVQGFSPLPQVQHEVDTIHRLYGGTVLKDEQFKIGTLESELTEHPYNIVHIASHGRFSSNIDDTFLLTYDGKLTMDKLSAFIARTAHREQALELLTLSACQTATGDERAALGLAGIAVKSGARSALATLWFISDEASSMLVSEFYRQLKLGGVSKAAALRSAQLALLDDRRYEHPSYWAPFLLIGNWL